MSQIDPSKAMPQAPRALRVGSKGHARAVAAKKDGKPEPGEEPDDDEDEELDAMGEHEPLRAAAEEAHAHAAAMYAASKGTDSAAALMAADKAGDDAGEAHQAAKASSAKMRGAAVEEAPPSSKRPGAPPAPAARVPVAGLARAIAGAGGTAEAQTKIAAAVGFADRMLALFGGASLEEAEANARAAHQVAPFGLHALSKLGLTAADTVRAKGILGSKLDLAASAALAKKSEAATKAQADTARREKLWEDAVADGRVQMPQAFARVDGPPGPNGEPTTKRVYAEWAAKQNAAYPEIEAFEAWISSRVPEPGARPVQPSTTLADIARDKLGAFVLTDRDKEEARRAGIDPAALAAQLRLQQRGATSGAGERA